MFSFLVPLPAPFRPPNRHYRTGEAPPPALLDGLHRSKTLFAGLGIQTQLLYATLDQQLFGPQVHGFFPSASVFLLLLLTLQMHEIFIHGFWPHVHRVCGPFVCRMYGTLLHCLEFLRLEPIV